ncbi:YoaK family protein [Dyadobacter sp. 3J3]|uniref:YoaK family protein n=1 Tax=Dyadobacter sp. 3J3 TaxID=2606600 RepID=UPI0013584C4F|nr:YoaK family protein [Dyadobacter sp. 3J3]
MFRHSGTHRTPKHNLKLATLLGLTAGFVNAEGFLGFSVLTTNITGHAALLAEGIAQQNWQNAQVIVLWMLLFLAGAFTSGLFLSLFGANQRYSYSIPLVIEIAVLVFSALYGYKFDGTKLSQLVFAGSLLFAMGLQNALVSLVSGSLVRTTHLTGTFTDLGIDLAQLVNSTNDNRPIIHSKIKLRLFIIGSFILGAIAGAYLFQRIGFKSFFVPVLILTFVLLYDIFRINVKRYYRTTSRAFKGDVSQN